MLIKHCQRHKRHSDFAKTCLNSFSSFRWTAGQELKLSVTVLVASWSRQGKFYIVIIKKIPLIIMVFQYEMSRRKDAEAHFCLVDIPDSLSTQPTCFKYSPPRSQIEVLTLSAIARVVSVLMSVDSW